MAGLGGALAEGLQRGFSIGLAMRQQKMQEQQAQQSEQRAKEDRDFRQKEFDDRRNFSMAQIELANAERFAKAGLFDRALETANPALKRLGLNEWSVWPQQGKEYFKVLGEAIAEGKKKGNWKQAQATVTGILQKAGEDARISQEEYPVALETAKTALEQPGEAAIGLMQEQLDFINEAGIPPDEKARRERLVGIREKIQEPGGKGATSYGGVDAEKANILFKSGSFKSQSEALMWLEDRKGMNESTMRLELFKHFTNPLMNKSPEEALKLAEENTKKLMDKDVPEVNEDAEIQSAVDREILEAIDKGGVYLQIEEHLKKAGRNPAKYLEKYKEYRPPVLKRGK